MAFNSIPNTFRTKYHDEFFLDFERERALFLQAVNSDGVLNGSTVAWDVVDPGDEAVVKGRDGKIPSSDLGLSEVTSTLVKHHKKYKVDNFDTFQGNPNLRTAMSRRGSGSINRSIDRMINDQLDTATNVASVSGALSSKGNVISWTNSLWDNDVPNEGDVWGAITNAAWGQMMRIDEFNRADYIGTGDVAKGIGGRVKTWMGVHWFVNTGLTGRKTNAAKCYIWHKSALGHMFSGDPTPILFQNEEEDYQGVRFEVMHTSKLCLQRGVIQYLHDDTAAFS